MSDQREPRGREERAGPRLTDRSPRKAVRRKFKLIFSAFFIAILGGWISYSIYLWQFFGAKALVVSPALMVASAAAGVQKAVQEVLHPSLGFTLSGVCVCGSPLKEVPRHINEVASEGPTAASYFEYHALKFARTGDNWQGGRALAQLSPDGHGLAFVSYSGPRRPGGIYFFDLKQQWWNVYIDAYETSSGRNLATLSWTRLRSAQPPRAGVFWGTKRTLLYSGDGAHITSGFCQTPPEIIALPDFAHATIILKDNSGATAKVSVLPLDGDGNGLMDSLSVDAEFVTPQRGRYRLTARLGRNEATTWFPGMSEVYTKASAEVEETLLPGTGHLRLHFDPNGLVGLPGSGPLFLNYIEIRGGRDLLLESKDKYTLPLLPPRETVPFQFSGAVQYGVGADVIEGTFRFLTPAGVCSWSGEVVQGDIHIPFNGRKRLEEGEHEIPFRAPARWLSKLQRHRLLARLTSFECGGRIAHARIGEHYLAEGEMGPIGQ